MRILLYSGHRYPADDCRGRGIAPRPEPSGAPQHIHDLIARGLGELGHDVFYYLEGGADNELPEGVRLADGLRDDVDVYHNIAAEGRPWVITQHRVRDEGPPPLNSVFVSHSLARFHSSERFVRNGLNPNDYIYSEAKDDYILFLSSMQGNHHAEKYRKKGLPVALELARTLGFRLVVAGTARDPALIEEIQALCRGAGAEFLGDVRGTAKAELIAGARALLFPTQIHEGLPLVVIEALFSGTPVIASDRGPCPEIVPPDTGFICRTTEDYAAAIANAGRIRPRDCRERAHREHHYLKMARGYLREYEIEVSNHG